MEREESTQNVPKQVDDSNVSENQEPPAKKKIVGMFSRTNLEGERYRYKNKLYKILITLEHANIEK